MHLVAQSKCRQHQSVPSPIMMRYVIVERIMINILESLSSGEGNQPFTEKNKSQIQQAVRNILQIQKKATKKKCCYSYRFSSTNKQDNKTTSLSNNQAHLLTLSSCFILSLSRSRLPRSRPLPRAPVRLPLSSPSPHTLEEDGSEMNESGKYVNADCCANASAAAIPSSFFVFVPTALVGEICEKR